MLFRMCMIPKEINKYVQMREFYAFENKGVREYGGHGTGHAKGVRATNPRATGGGTGGVHGRPRYGHSSDLVPPAYEDVVGHRGRRGDRTPPNLLILKEIPAAAPSPNGSTLSASALLSGVCEPSTFVLPRDCCSSTPAQVAPIVATPLFSMDCSERSLIDN